MVSRETWRKSDEKLDTLVPRIQNIYANTEIETWACLSDVPFFVTIPLFGIQSNVKIFYTESETWDNFNDAGTISNEIISLKWDNSD